MSSKTQDTTTNPLLHPGSNDTKDPERVSAPSSPSSMNSVNSPSHISGKTRASRDEGSSKRVLRTRLCEMLGCEVPIMLAGMGGIAGPELVAAVTNAGGFGTFGSALDVANKGPEELLEQIQQISTLCNGKPFGVDILVHGGSGGVMKQLIDAFAKGGAKAFISGKGFPRPEVIQAFHDRGMVVGSIAGKVSHAVKAVAAGVDFVVVQGCEGGGHTGEVTLSVLLPQVVDAIANKVPVVAAGGIFDARGVAAALSMGASGVWVGTRFMLTPEANTHPKYKEKLLRASSDDTMVTKAYSGARMRVLRNPYVTKFEQDPSLLEEHSPAIAKRAWNDGAWKLHSGDASDYDDSVQAYVTGQNVGAITELKPAGEIVREMAEGAVRIFQIAHNLIVLDNTITDIAHASQPARAKRLQTKLCDMLGCKHPVMLAGMGGIAAKELVAAVTNAGGFGTYGSSIDVANKGPEELLEEVESISRACGGRPFGVDILVHGSSGGVMKQLVDAFAKGGARAFISGKGFPRREVIDAFHERQMVVGSIAGKVSHAVKAVDAGVDFVIVQGAEGGGHTGAVALSVLLPQVVDAVNGRVPVVAAGGIFDGRGLAAAIQYGASGVWIGTRFMLTPEANTHPKYKERLLQASSDDTVVTKAYTGAPLRVLKNPYVDKFEQDPTLLESNSAKVAKRAWNDGVWKLHGGNAQDYDDSVQAYVTGQDIGAINELVPAAAIVKDMVSKAIEIIETNAQLLHSSTSNPLFPAASTSAKIDQAAQPSLRTKL